jgi:non-specific protein-tyrosine kinase
MELFHYLRILRRRWSIVAASVLLALTAAAVATARMSPQYAASITMVVSVPDDGENPAAAYQAALLSQDRAKSYAKLLQSRSVAAAVSSALGNGLTAEELQRKVSAAVVPETVLLRATVTDRSPELAMRIGHTLGSEFARYVDGLERPKSGAPARVRVTVADDADLPREPVSPRPLRNLGLGLVVGLVIGALGAALRDLTDTSIRSARSLREAAGGVALGAVTSDGRLGFGVRGDSPHAEAFRGIRTNLRFAEGDALPRSVAVTSALPGEGKSMIACNLAVSLAEAGWRVILLDADLRGSRLASRLDIDETPGLAEVLAHDRPVRTLLRQWGPDSLSVLPAGSVTGPSGELLASRKMPSVLRELERQADIVVVDAPSLLSATDAAILARGCAGAILVAWHGRTRREDVVRGVERLEAVHARVVGTVLNGDQPTGRPPGHGGFRLLRPVHHRRLAAQR